MLIDFEKAFDSVSWEFLYETLKLLGFGPKMIKWITLFKTNIMGYVLQSGFLSQPFPINRGCKTKGPYLLQFVYSWCTNTANNGLQKPNNKRNQNK